MATFQRKAWEERAWARYERQRSKDPATEPKARLRLDCDLNAVSGLSVIVEWINHRGIKVEFTNSHAGGIYSTGEKTIYVNSTQTFEHQLFVLLHESGHLLIGFTDPSTPHRFRLGYPSSNDPALKGKFIHRCAILEEEFEAWHRGRRLAKKLGINIDDNSWSELKSQFIKSYIKWSLRHDDYESTP